MAKLYYQILNIESSASQQDITRAYRTLALKYHPDKASGSTELFQRIQQAYDILKDSKKRKVYDRTGTPRICPTTPPGKVSQPNDFDDLPRVDPEDIEALARTYPNSASEDEDIIEFFQTRAGDIITIFNSIPFTKPSLTEANRLIHRIETLINDGRLVATEKWTTSSSKLRKKVPKLEKDQAKEEKRFAKDYGDTSFADLAAKIAENQRRRRQECENTFAALKQEPTKSHKRLKK